MIAGETESYELFDTIAIIYDAVLLGDADGSGEVDAVVMYDCVEQGQQAALLRGFPAGQGRRTGDNPSRFGNSVSDKGVGGDSRLSGDHDGAVPLLVQLHELAHSGVNQVLVRQAVNACYLTYF